MPAIAAVVINDGAATPVAHTFSPVSIVGDVAKLADRSGGIALGYPVITQSVRSPGNGLRTYKVVQRVLYPILEVTSPSTSSGIQPAPTLAYNLMCNIEWVLPERSTLAERKNLKAFVKNYLAHSNTTVVVEDFDTLY
jgi:hypothetical protein